MFPSKKGTGDLRRSRGEKGTDWGVELPGVCGRVWPPATTFQGRGQCPPPSPGGSEGPSSLALPEFSLLGLGETFAFKLLPSVSLVVDAGEQAWAPRSPEACCGASVPRSCLSLCGHGHGAGLRATSELGVDGTDFHNMLMPQKLGQYPLFHGNPHDRNVAAACGLARPLQPAPRVAETPHPEFSSRAVSVFST